MVTLPDKSPTPSSSSCAHGLLQMAIELGRIRQQQEALGRALDLTIRLLSQTSPTRTTPSSTATSTAMWRRKPKPTGRPTSTDTNTIIRKAAHKALMETVVWALGKVGSWLLTNLVPMLITAAMGMLSTFLGVWSTLGKWLGPLLRALGLG